MDFENAVKIILRHEGGFTHHPKDPGGDTNMGITHATLKRWRGMRELPDDAVAKLERQEAVDIYKSWYWDKSRCTDMPDGVDLMLFDAAVNHGTTGAARMLQQAVHTVTDGIIGPVTVKAVWKSDPDALLKEFAAIRADLYETANEVFERGWFRRLFDIFYLAIKDRANG